MAASLRIVTMSFLYAVGDIHGRFDLLKQAILAIESDSDAATVVFLGDYIDRGPQSRQVLETLMAGPKRSGDRWICLQGNHEVMMVAARHSRREMDRWLGNGGEETLDSFGGQVPETVLAWCAALPLKWETEHHFFVHAGIRPGVALAEQEPETMLWVRDLFLDDARDHGKHIVHGHTPFQEAQLRRNRTNLDSMAFKTGRLSIGKFDAAQNAGPVKVIEVTDW
jgi:serine/threonine protein phosphatase 1